MALSEEYRAEVQRADGELLPLQSDRPLLEGLHIAVRHVQNPLQAPNPDASSDFYGWTNMWPWKDGEKAQTGSIAINAYVESDGDMIPVGHMDWWLLDDYANGGGNEHAAFMSKANHETEAAKRWDDSIAFKVDPTYHRQGLGSLMLATSSIALPALGAERFYSGCLLEPAKNTYARFGIYDRSWPRRSHTWSDRSLPIEELSEHPYVAEILGQFIMDTEPADLAVRL